LRDQGADITNKDIFGYNIFDIAEKTNNKEIKNILHEYYQSAEPINVRKEKVVVAQNQPKPVVSKRAKENENSLANKQFAEHNINETPQKAPIAKVEQEAIIDHELETERRKMIEQEANNKRKQHMQQLVEKIKTKEATKVANKDLTTPSKNEEISLDKAAPIVQPAEKIDEAKLTNPQSSKLEQLPTKNIYAEAKKMELPALNKKSNVADIKEEKTKEEMLTPNVIEAADNPVLNAFELKKEIVPKKENTIKKAKTDASNSVKNIKNSTERPVVLENIETESNNEINNTPADSNISEIAGSTYGRENKLLTPQIIEDNYYKKVSTRRSKLKIGKAQKVTTKEAKQVQLTTKSSKSNDYWLILQTGYINQGDKILHKTIDVIRDYDLKYQIIKNLVDNRQYIKVGPIKDIVEAEYYCNKTLQSPYYNKCSVRRH
jgi:hypothetical protein